MGISEKTTKLAPGFDGIYVAEGLLDMEGFLFYHIGCLFILDDIENPTLRLHADGVGDDFDLSVCEMEGSFSQSPKDLEGTCHFSLEAADFEEGGIELTIYKDDEVVGVFTGASEGIGEAVITNKKGKLTIPKPKEHTNTLTFKGESGIDNINFYYGNVNSITPGQPWGDVVSVTKDDGATVEVKIDAGRKADKDNATWFNQTVGSKNDKMFHTRGGDNIPTKLNFAIKGILEINSQRFNICLGQGTSGSYNNWHVASEDINSTHPYKSGDIGNFHLTQSGSSEFIVKIK